MTALLRQGAQRQSPATLLGLEGTAARAYFDCLKVLVGAGRPMSFAPTARNRRPPRDRFNCLLSFGYVCSVARSPHNPCGWPGGRAGVLPSAAHAAPPLVLDLMELFRTLLWDIPLIGSLNRGQWNPADDFNVTPGQVWLSDAGRRRSSKSSSSGSPSPIGTRTPASHSATRGSSNWKRACWKRNGRGVRDYSPACG